MAVYAPVYKPRGPTPGSLAHEAKKRKRGQRDSPAQHDPSDSPEPASPLRDLSSHPVNSTDPYFVAGLSRQDNLPLFPFPHAPVKTPSAPKIPLVDELAALNPPLLSVAPRKDDGNASLKQRHLDNLTAILHQCMLRGDWQGASRVWGLLVRTEINGRGVDLRQHGRWGIGAEILMQRSKAQEPPPELEITSLEDLTLDDQDAADRAVHKGTASSPERDEGFALARSYYERLILQYPHTPRTQRTINATVFYPALFNVWIYEVQGRHGRNRVQTSKRRSLDSVDAEREIGTSVGSDTATSTQTELNDALAIAHRMDEVLASPPYDSSIPLLQLRGMIGLWLVDLHDDAAKALRSLSAERDEGDFDGRHEARLDSDRHLAAARKERERGVALLRKVRDAGSGGTELGRVLSGLGEAQGMT
ncbi:hypothetical protein B0A48_12085 [Cryoendolithus antarcticus]|uniref:Uncharacterized protein n=1 Tax=Cryoendolithus antarcticus TaxID=1507870 RepID=A0A1V8STN6_9PEZI|nr:hypothetical protein B0A48_12085 [Cryoendolithus antarcticus]